ncbi:two-component system sensor histidine kinase SenX3 [Kineococcus xinjiangensis]|uniref:Sensor-like histidine kinase SenX3 n=1 Tax=Kineococcus xinjiangensis TaxID=512762 RepID=A0A2S6ICU4_9ACTN|nr:ATP-binding protein [Kineococcus xinjiangensis]PPK92044.1 two-component system sensor histidine kinase SenX3 [Kineococcus xinjiangensis]
MTPEILAIFAGCVGAVVGAGAVLAFWFSEHQQEAPRAQPGPADLPAGVGDVLAALRSSAVVMGDADEVVRASAAAYATGIVSGRELVHAPLRQMVRQCRRDGEVHEAELELPAGPMGRGASVVRARVSWLGAHHVLLLVEDHTEARRVEEVRRDFLVNVSHELKTPVGALSLLAEAVDGAADDPEAVRHFASQMQRESVRLADLVKEIIDLSRLQSSPGVVQPKLLSVDDVITEAVDRTGSVVKARDAEVVVAGEEQVQVVGDHELLVTAVRNLVHNAVAYSPEGSKVVVETRRVGGSVEIAVIDRGVGIPAADLDRIFERFYRVDPARSRLTGGTGLGLSIVKHIAANHRGEVTVWSVVGEGSTFTLRLPDATDTVASPVSPAGVSAPAAAPGRAAR